MFKKHFLKGLMILMFIALIITPQTLFAGGLKAKVQQKVLGSTVQYEPYYLNANYQVDRQEDEAQVLQGFQQSVPQAVPVQNVNNLRRDRGLEQTDYPVRNAAASPIPSTNISSYAIYSVEYKSEIEDNVVTVNGHVTFEVFRKTGITQVPLVKSSVGLLDVKVNKGSAFVVNQSGMYYLIINKPGKYVLDLEFLIKGSREREHGPGNFLVDVVPAPLSQFEFTIPEKDVQIFIEPAIKVEQEDLPEKTTAWAVMPNTSQITVRWTKALPKEEIVSVKLDPKVYVETATHSSVGGGVISSYSILSYSILQSEISSLRLILPQDVTILNVQGNELRDWKVSVKEGIQYLDVFLNFGVKGNYQLSLTYERNIAEGSSVVQMPWVHALGVERENGFYGVAASSNVELAVKSSDRVTVIDTKQLPSNIWGISPNPILLAFKYLNHPIDITIDVKRHEEVQVLISAIDSAQHTTLYTKEGKILTKSVYQVRNNVKQFLRIMLPKDAVIWSSFVAGKPVKPARDENGYILLPLEKSSLQGQDLTQFPVEVVYLDKGADLKSFGQGKLELPKVDVPINEFNWSVYLPMDYFYFNFGGDVRPVKDVYAQQTFGGLSPQRRIQGRLKSAADDIGDQFAATNYAASSKENWSKDESIMAKGILPIKINIPQQGQLFRFSKLLVVEGESPSLTFRYTVLIDKVWHILKLVFLFLIILWIVRWFSRKLFKK